MDKVVTTALLTIASLLAGVMVVNTILPALGRSGGSVLSSSTAASEIIKTEVEIISIAASSSQIVVWIKNVGAATIEEIEKSEVFVEDIGTSFTRIAHDSGQTGSCTFAPSTVNEWAYCVEDGEALWKTAGTVKIVILWSGAPSGLYQLQFVTANGVRAEKAFSA